MNVQYLFNFEPMWLVFSIILLFNGSCMQFVSPTFHIVTAVPKHVDKNPSEDGHS
jgi:hypothetical protein